MFNAVQNADQWASNRFPFPTPQQSIAPDDQHPPSQVQHNGQAGPGFTDSGTWEDHFSNEKGGARKPRFQITPFTIFGRNIKIGKFQLERVVEKGNKPMKIKAIAKERGVRAKVVRKNINTLIKELENQ